MARLAELTSIKEKSEAEAAALLQQERERSESERQKLLDQLEARNHAPCLTPPRDSPARPWVSG